MVGSTSRALGEGHWVVVAIQLNEVPDAVIEATPSLHAIKKVQGKKNERNNS